jgi:hypothetical protein
MINLGRPVILSCLGAEQFPALWTRASCSPHSGRGRRRRETGPYSSAEERDFGCMHGHALNGMHSLCLEVGL